MRRVMYKLHFQQRSCFRFSILSVPYMQDTFVPISNFEVGHFLSFGVVMKGIQFTQLQCHLSFLSFIRLTTCFLLSLGRLLDSRNRWLICLLIQHTTHCLFERQTPVGSLEAAVCGFCLSISLHKHFEQTCFPYYKSPYRILISCIN